jgi:hypothetical protein
MSRPTISQDTRVVEAPNIAALLNASQVSKWVAFTADYSRGLAAANTLPQLLEQLSDDDKAADPVFYKVPDRQSYYIPAIQ